MTSEAPMTVKELIDLLLTYPQDLPVAYSIYSEQCLLEADDITVADLCRARPDGWIQNKRPDMPTQQYLLFPGN
jgi:hypothetical protein